MFEISQLKEKKLPELQGIAKDLKVAKFRSLKKLDQSPLARQVELVA